jgi:hypothetical protein
LLGFIAFREDWVDHLYVRPGGQRQGLGTELLGVAQAAFGRLQLWAFQRNLPARRFYEQRGFALVEEADGSGNEEWGARCLLPEGATAGIMNLQEVLARTTGPMYKRT